MLVMKDRAAPGGLQSSLTPVKKLISSRFQLSVGMLAWFQTDKSCEA